MKFWWFRKRLSVETAAVDMPHKNEFHDSSIILSQGVYRRCTVEEDFGDVGVQLRRPIEGGKQPQKPTKTKESE